MIKCIVVDDEPLARSLLESHIAEVPYLKLMGSFKNALEANQFLAKETIDLVLLDIQMPRLTGLELLRSIANPPHVIFTTAYREYALESYDFEAVDYLLKPITFSRFLKAVNKLLRKKKELSMPQNEAQGKEYLFLKINRKKVKVIMEDILYIESLKDYIHIHLSENKLLVKMQLGQIMEHLPSYFIRVHRSYIINTTKVTAYTAEDIEIGALEIPIGGTYKDYVFAYLEKD
ncbi:MAG: LytTR family DNA-binding domain-containing protein [Bacteroidota bacterium]